MVTAVQKKKLSLACILLIIGTMQWRRKRSGWSGHSRTTFQQHLVRCRHHNRKGAGLGYCRARDLQPADHPKLEARLYILPKTEEHDVCSWDRI